jgi:hypothetical protein
VFSGDNGQGKTNLLEAIFVVAALRSFRTAKLSDLVAFGESRASSLRSAPPAPLTAPAAPRRAACRVAPARVNKFETGFARNYRAATSLIAIGSRSDPIWSD